MRIHRFNAGGLIYTFPTIQAEFVTNFANLVPATARLPGLSGGFDDYGDDAAPSEIGRVTLNFTLVAYSRADMTARRDAVYAMAGWGQRRLWLRPTNHPTDPERWCNAKVNSIRMVERLDANTDL